MVGATASALIGVMNLLLSKLSTLLEREFGKLTGVKQDIAFLRDELNSMNTALEAVSRAEEVSSQTKDWMGQLRELSYDAEDCIENFTQNLDNQDSYGAMWKAFYWLITIGKRHSIADEIAVLKQRAEDIHSRRKRFEFNTAPSTSTFTCNAMAIDPRLPALFEEADRLVGVEGSKDELVKWLTGDINSAKKRRVISIVGSGGLGKTTLANLVYKEIKSQFDCTAFVSVSEHPDINKILKDILSQVLETSSHASDERKKTIESKLGLGPIEDHQLIRMTREYLKNYRYLILIDDIWSKEAWEAMKYAFPDNDYTSGIVTTTRKNDVAKLCCFPHEEYAYSIKPLTSDDSKRLFFKKMFVSEEECSEDLKEIADEILKKCDGLPLAIINIASLLATKAATRQEWKRVLESISFPLINQDYELEVVKRVLSVSYYDLPHHLKICLLYLSVYPEDHIINREQLIWKWIAEGFIIGQHGQNLEEVGEIYFNELINRNMIQLVEADITGRGLSCRVHDMMLDLLISLSSEENFVTIVNSQRLASSANKTRRLSLQGNCEENQAWLDIGNFSHVRSLNVFGDCEQLPPLKGLQTLRVLDLLDQSCFKEDDEGHIEDIVSLLQLRYLYVCRRITKVPREIRRLQLLQTLDLTMTRVEELPATIVQLQKLVRLLVPHSVKLPSGISNMRALEELWNFDCSINSANIVLELGNLVKLKKLGIIRALDKSDDMEKYKESLLSSLCKLGERSLEYLSIRSMKLCDVMDWFIDSWRPAPRNLQYLSMRYWFDSFTVPRRIASFSTLVFLSITVSQMHQEYMETLRKLPVLVHLLVEIVLPNTVEVPYLGNPSKEAFTINHVGFQCLKRLDIIMHTLYAAVERPVDGPLMFEEGAVRKLEILNIECPGLYMVSAEGVGLDLGIHHIKSLKHLKVSLDCSRMSALEVYPVEAAIRNAATLIPSHPKLEIIKIGEEKDTPKVEEEQNIWDLLKYKPPRKLVPVDFTRWSFL